MSKVQPKIVNQIYSVFAVLLCVLIDAAILIPWTLTSPSAPTDRLFKVNMLVYKVIQRL